MSYVDCEAPALEHLVSSAREGEKPARERQLIVHQLERSIWVFIVVSPSIREISREMRGGGFEWRLFSSFSFRGISEQVGVNIYDRYPNFRSFFSYKSM